MASDASRGRARQKVAAAGVPTGLSGVKVRVTAVLGSAEITFDEAVALDPESMISMDRGRDDPVDLCVNGEVVARGRLVVVGDTYGVQITELVERKLRR